MIRDNLRCINKMCKYCLEEKCIQPWYTIVGTGPCKDHVIDKEQPQDLYGSIFGTGTEVNNLKKALDIVLDEKDCINNLVSNLTMEEIERLKLLEQQTAICEIENTLRRLIKIRAEAREVV